MTIYENIELYETNVSKDKAYTTKVIKEIIDETLGKNFKDIVQKTELFVAKIRKISKKLQAEEKECDKAYQNFIAMLEEAEI